ncbi:MAG: hypothetical protein ABI605_10710 [Rhizobacter sp.]
MAESKLRRIAPTRTVALESLADLQAFRAALTKRFSLPRVRIALRIGELHEPQRSEHELQINRLLAACGCAEGAIGALLLLGLAFAFPLRPAGADTASAMVAWAAEAVLGFMIGGLAGKLAGLGRARHRLRRLCERLETELSGPR